MKRRIQWSRIFMIFICLILILGSGLSLFLNLPKEDQSTLKKETVVDNQKTLQNFLTIAIQPVGQRCMFGAEAGMKKIQELAKMPNASGLFAMENFF